MPKVRRSPLQARWSRQVTFHFWALVYIHDPGCAFRTQDRHPPRTHLHVTPGGSHPASMSRITLFPRPAAPSFPDSAGELGTLGSGWACPSRPLPSAGSGAAASQQAPGTSSAPADLQLFSLWPQKQPSGVCSLHLSPSLARFPSA